MLRRDLREIYHFGSPDQVKKDRVLEMILEQRPKDTELRGRKWKPRGQAGAWICVVLILLIVFGAAGYGIYVSGLYEYAAQIRIPESTAAQTYPEEETGTPSSEPVQTEPEHLSYKPLAAKYVQAVQEKWDMIRCQEEQISYLVMFLDKPEDLSCAIVDLDGNGIQEFIVTDGNVIYDLYTCANGEYVHLLSGGERNTFTLTADNLIVNTRSGGAGNTVFSVQMYYGQNLISVELIVCDASKDSAHPWFRGIDNPDDVKPITEQEARDIIAMYPAAPIPCSVITAHD